MPGLRRPPSPYATASLVLLLTACSQAHMLDEDSEPGTTGNPSNGGTLDAGDGQASDSGGATDAVADAVADAPVTLDAATTPCGLRDSSCPFEAGQLRATGTGPGGDVRLDWATVVYLTGFTPGTTLRLHGRTGEERFELQATITDWVADDPTVAAPGVYATNAWLQWEGPGETCTRREIAVSVRIDIHDVTGLESGDAVTLEGTLTSSDAEWPVELSFGLTSSCGFEISI